MWYRSITNINFTRETFPRLRFKFKIYLCDIKSIVPSIIPIEMFKCYRGGLKKKRKNKRKKEIKHPCKICKYQTTRLVFPKHTRWQVKLWETDELFWQTHRTWSVYRKRLFIIPVNANLWTSCVVIKWNNRNLNAKSCEIGMSWRQPPSDKCYTTEDRGYLPV